MFLQGADSWHGHFTCLQDCELNCLGERRIQDLNMCVNKRGPFDIRALFDFRRDLHQRQLRSFMTLYRCAVLLSELCILRHLLL